MLSSLPWLVVMVAEHRIIKKCIDQMYRAEFLKTYKNSFFLFIFHYKSNSIRDGENWNSTNWDNIKSVLWHLSPFFFHWMPSVFLPFSLFSNSHRYQQKMSLFDFRFFKIIPSNNILNTHFFWPAMNFSMCIIGKSSICLDFYYSFFYRECWSI